MVNFSQQLQGLRQTRTQRIIEQQRQREYEQQKAQYEAQQRQQQLEQSPEYQEQQKQQQLRQEAQTQVQELDKLSQEASQKAIEYKQKEQQTTGSTSEGAGKQAFYYEQLADYYSRGKQYATGEYSLQDIKGWAMSNAEGRIEKFEYEKSQPIEPQEVTKVYEIPRTIITKEGTFYEYKSGERVKASDERIPTTYNIPYISPPSKIKQVYQTITGTAGDVINAISPLKYFSDMKIAYKVGEEYKTSYSMPSLLFPLASNPLNIISDYSISKKLREQGILIEEKNIQSLKIQEDIVKKSEELRQPLTTSEMLSISQGGNIEEIYKGKQKIYEQEYPKFQSYLNSQLSNLKIIGTETITEKTENGEIMKFKPIYQIAPYSIVVGKDLPMPVKIAYFGTKAGIEAGELYLGSYAIGKLGVYAKISDYGSRITQKVIGTGKTYKVLKYGFYAGTLGLTGLGIYRSGEKKEIEMQQVEGYPKNFGRILGITSGTLKTGAIVYGGYVGTKEYFAKIQKQILEGQYTKTYTTRKGVTEFEEGEFKRAGVIQKDISTTTIKGTKYKIRTYSVLKGTYGAKQGASQVDIYGEFVGKRPTGYPKTFKMSGGTLETSKYLRARIFSTLNKKLSQQDFLAERFGEFEVSKQMESGNEMKLLNFLSKMKSGERITIKSIPKPIWDEGETYRFFNYEGAGKVRYSYEWTEFTPSKIAKISQIIKVYPKATKVVGATTYENIESQLFESIGKTQGYSPELLKDKILVYAEKSKDLFLLNVGKKGQTTFFPQQFATTTPSTQIETPKNLNFEVNLIKTNVDTNRIILKSMEPLISDILQRQTIRSISTLGVSSLLVSGTSQMKIKNLSLLKLQPIQQTRQIAENKLISITPQTTAQRINQVQKQILRQIQISTPNVPPYSLPYSPPIIQPSFPMMPLIPFLDLGSGMNTPSGKRKKKGTRYALLPDFISRMLGLQPQKIARSNIERELRRIKTGIELRRGGIPA